MLDDLEVNIQNYFEKLESLCHEYRWETILELESLSKSFNDFTNVLKSFHSLYPDKKVRETSSNQLLSFLSNVNTFLGDVNSSFITKFILLIDTLKNNLFHVLTKNQPYLDIQKNLNELKLPEFDFNFVRFFFSQIINRWVIDDEHYFDIFLTDIEKTSEIIPLFKQLFSNEIISSLKLGKINQISSNINQIADKIERQLLIIPIYLAEQCKIILIDFLSFVHKFPDVIVLQSDLENLNNELLNKNLIFSSEFSQACKNQIEIIRTIKKKIDLDPEFFEKYEIDNSLYDSKVTQLEQMIFAHNDILDQLHNLKEVKTLSVDSLINTEILFLELLKNNLNLFIQEIKNVFLSYIESTIYLIDWWNNTKKFLLHQSHIYFLMFENLPQTEKIQTVQDIKTKYFKNLFLSQKRFFSFIQEVAGDLIPIFDHFTVIHKTIFNGLQDFDKWDEVQKTDPIKNAKAIIEAIIHFFKRWNEQKLQDSFQSNLQSYNVDFVAFYNTFSELYSQYMEVKQTRFKNPKKSIQIIDLLMNQLQNSEKLIYKLFSTNLELMKSIEKVRIEVSSFKVLIIYFDKLNEEILNLLAQNWDAPSLKPYLNIMKENLEKFPVSPENFANREKLKVFTLFNFIISLGKIDEYLNDQILSTIAKIENFSVINADLMKSKQFLLSLYSLLPENKKDSIESFNKNINQFFSIISVTWLKLAKNVETFLNNQSKRISLTDRKTLLTQLENYNGTTINFLFKWPVFENHFKRFDKEFFPQFKKYFSDLILLEEHWQQSIGNLSSNKNLNPILKSLNKETENFISNVNLDLYINPFFIKVNKILEKRLELIKYSTDDSLSIEKMKELLI